MRFRCYNRDMRLGLSRAVRALVLVSLATAVSAAAQQREPSHSERFSASRGRVEDVERDATAALVREPGDVDALLSRARARLQLGKTAEGLADFEYASTLAPARADVRGQLALAHFRLGRLADAKFAADAALSIDAENPSAHYALGLILLMATSELDAAIQHLERAAARGPAAPEVRFDLLRAYVRKGDRIRATVQLRLLRALLPPADSRVIHSEGLLAALNGNLEQAVASFRKTPQAKPALPLAPVEGALAMGRALAKQGKTDQAIALFQEAARRFPDSVEAHHELAKAFKQAGRAQEAKAEFDIIEQLGRKFGVAPAAPVPGKPKP